MAQYTGSLHHMKKDELKEIAEILSMPTDGTKVELEVAIKERLVNDDGARKDPRLSGISALKPRVNGSLGSPSRSPPVTGSVGTPSVLPATTPKVAKQARKISKSVSKADLSDATKYLAGTVKGAIENGVERVDQLPVVLQQASQDLVHVANRQLKVVKSTNRHQVLNTVALWSHKTEETVGKSLRQTQATLSDGWTVILLSIAAELLFVLAASIPYTKQVKLGPFEWLSRPWTAETPYTTIPDLVVLRQYTVFRPIVIWLIASFIIPFLGAHLIVFPKPTEHKARGRPPVNAPGKYYFGLNPPSALTFSILRVALAVYLNKMTATPAISFTYDIVHRFGSIQLLLSSVALAFSTYELLAGH